LSRGNGCATNLRLLPFAHGEFTLGLAVGFFGNPKLPTTTADCAVIVATALSGYQGEAPGYRNENLVLVGVIVIVLVLGVRLDFWISRTSMRATSTMSLIISVEALGYLAREESKRVVRLWND